jgi:hypothetical protein
MSRSDASEMGLPASAVLTVAGLRRAFLARSLALIARRASSYRKLTASTMTLIGPLQPGPHQDRGHEQRRSSPVVDTAKGRCPRISAGGCPMTGRRARGTSFACTGRSVQIAAASGRSHPIAAWVAGTARADSISRFHQDPADALRRKARESGVQPRSRARRSRSAPSLGWPRSMAGCDTVSPTKGEGRRRLGRPPVLRLPLANCGAPPRNRQARHGRGGPRENLAGAALRPAEGGASQGCATEARHAASLWRLRGAGRPSERLTKRPGT